MNPRRAGSTLAGRFRGTDEDKQAMNTWHKHCMGLLAAFTLTSSLWAQAPGVPGAPAAAAPAAPAGAAGAAGAAGDPSQGFAFIQKFQAQCDICKRKLCATPLGEFINNMTKPMTMMSGGLIPPCCPTAPSAAELAEAADDPGPLGAAAQVAADEAKAKKRRAAVRYLSTADCHWWPEVEKALIVALRTDRNECVRLEAAMGLGHGCCCTRRVIEALAITVEGSSRDGNPSENSERVRACALQSLNHCLGCYRSPPEPVGGEQKEKPQPLPPSVQAPVEALKSKIQLSAYYMQLDKKPMAEVVARARQVAAAASPTGPLAPRPSENSFREIFFPGQDNLAADTVIQQGAAGSTVVTASGNTVISATPDVQVINETPAAPVRFPLIRRWANGSPSADVPMEMTPVPMTPETLHPVPMSPSKAPATVVPATMSPVPMTTETFRPVPTSPISKAPANVPPVARLAPPTPVVVATVKSEPLPVSSFPASKNSGVVTVSHQVPVANDPVVVATVKSEPLPVSQVPAWKNANVVPVSHQVPVANEPVVVATVKSEPLPVSQVPSWKNANVVPVSHQVPVANEPVVVATVKSEPLPVSQVPAWKNTNVVPANHQVMLANDAGSPYAIMNNKPATPSQPVGFAKSEPVNQLAFADQRERIIQPVAFVKSEPVPFDDLIGPKGRTVTQGQSVPAKTTSTLATASAPIVAASMPPIVAASVPPARPISLETPKTQVVAVATMSRPAANETAKAPPLFGGLARQGRPNDVGKLLRTLQNDSNLASRRKALDELEQLNLQNCKEAVPAFVQSACADSDPDMRVRCIRYLMQLNPSDNHLRTLVDRLQSDTDGEVQFQLFMVRERLDHSRQVIPASKS
ncbi:hypothetical protein AYO44_02860 [Planctomycetaceae bacterium SCGC AG-212-F19]|nr:hypothetical protein AYO44_02860 [Planctomycetaceae bacterium SCGC AG-212-F19]